MPVNWGGVKDSASLSLDLESGTAGHDGSDNQAGPSAVASSRVKVVPAVLGA